MYDFKKRYVVYRNNFSKTSEPDYHNDTFAIFVPRDHCAVDLFEVLVNSGI